MTCDHHVFYNDHAMYNTGMYYFMYVNLELGYGWNETAELAIQTAQNNLPAINVFDPKLYVTTSKELAKMGTVDLISGIGGILGLFIGASFLSHIDAFVLIVKLVLA